MGKEQGLADQTPACNSPGALVDGAPWEGTLGMAATGCGGRSSVLRIQSGPLDPAMPEVIPPQAFSITWPDEYPCCSGHYFVF